jgi:hypothetical protein
MVEASTWSDVQAIVPCPRERDFEAKLKGNLRI